MSFVERSIILCPYLGGSTIGGSTVHAFEVSKMYYMYYKSMGMMFSNCFYSKWTVFSDPPSKPQKRNKQ